MEKKANQGEATKENKAMLKVTFETANGVEIIEELSDGADYNLRAMALNWRVVSVEEPKKTRAGHAIGETIYMHGDNFKIVNEPYAHLGRMFQDATSENGATIIILAPECRDADIARDHEADKRFQEGIRRVHIAS